MIELICNDKNERNYEYKNSTIRIKRIKKNYFGLKFKTPKSIVCCKLYSNSFKDVLTTVKVFIDDEQ